MIQFFKELYLGAFAILFRLSCAKDIAYKAGGAIAAITVIESFALVGISGYVEMFLNRKFLFRFSEPVVLIVFFTLFFVNGYILFFRRHGIKFAHEFDSLKKSRRIFLEVSCAVVMVAVIVFFIFSAIAHRRFIGAT